jgi:acetyltransferase EpsM
MYGSVGYGTVIQPGTHALSNAVLGNHVQINMNCAIGHDSAIDDFVTFGLGVNCAGNVHVKEGAYIGSGAFIHQGVTVGEWSRVGANAAVLTDVPPNTTAVGVPARTVLKRKPGWHGTLFM